MTKPTKTLNCHNCAGAIETTGETSRVDCPYCGESVWAPLSAEEIGKANARLMEVLQHDYHSELQRIESLKAAALESHDKDAYAEVIKEEGKLYARAYDKIDYWELSGLTREQFLKSYGMQNSVVTNVIFESKPEEPDQPWSVTPAQAAMQMYYKTYSEALDNEDAQGFAWAWRQYMEASYSQGMVDHLSEEEIDMMIRGSMENMLRNQSWITSEDLEALGFDTTYDMEDQEESDQVVECQNCGAWLETMKGSELVECPYCDGVTHIQLSLRQQSVIAKDAFQNAQDHSGGAGGNSQSPKMLSFAKTAVSNGYPDVDEDSPEGRVLTFMMLENLVDSMTEAESRDIRQTLDLGPGDVTCGVCQTKLAEVEPALKCCVVCQSALV